MSKTRDFMICVLLGITAGCVIALTLAGVRVLHSVNEAVSQIQPEFSATRTGLMVELESVRSDMDRELDATRAQLLDLANAQATGLRSDAKAELEAYRQSADARLQDTLTRVDDALGQVTDLRRKIDPIAANVEAITAHANEASAILFRRDALPAQLLGLTAAGKVALGQTALTMRVIQQTTPEITRNVAKATEESATASEKTAEVMSHLAEATRPLPKWLRVVLMVVPPLASTAAGMASVMAATGTIP